MDPLASTIGAILPFLNYLRPSKSPYLLISIVLSILLVIYGSEYQGNLYDFLYRAPIYGTLLFILYMSFRFVPEELEIIKNEKDAEKIAEIQREMDAQYKFSRSIIICASLIAIFSVFSSGQFGHFLHFAFYTSVIINIALFYLYMFFRNIKEENPFKYAIFQISFMMSTFIIASSFILAMVDIFDQRLFFNTIEAVDDVTGDVQLLSVYFDWRVIDFLVIWFCWLCYQIFWIFRLRSIIKLSIVG